MENEIQSPPKNDQLSQSYCDGIEKIVGRTVTSVVSFQVPPKILEERKAYWHSFFDKYAEEISNEVELDIDTLEPVLPSVPKHDVEDVVEEYSPLRIPMRKPLSLVQHWVNTGNLLHQDLPDNSKSPVTQPTVNKQVLLKQSVGPKKVRKSNTRNWRAPSGSLSSSSVDTAAYILSNANRTKKADATAIVEGSKLQKNMGNQETKPAEECPPVGSDEGSGHTSNEDMQDTPVKSIVHLQPDQAAPDPILKSRHPIASLAETNMLHNTILTPDSIGPENNNAQFPNQNIMLMETIEKALKCLTSNSVITPSQSDHDSVESSSSHDEHSSVTESQVVSNDTSKIRRKKLYSGRDSPVDLINVRSSVGNKLSQTKEVLHPAFDPITSSAKSSYMKKRKLLAIKRRQKWTSLFAKSTMNKTGQTEGSEDKSQVTDKSKELNNTTAKDITKVRIRPARKIISQKVRFTPKRTPMRRKLPAGNLKEPVILLKRLPKQVVRKYNLFSPKSSPRMNPVVNLTKLSDSYIKKYISRNTIKPVRTNVASTDKSAEPAENRQNRISKALKKKSAKGMLPPDTEYIDSDETDSSRSTILFINCLENAKAKRCIMSDSSPVADKSSQDLLCKEQSAIPIAKCLKRVDGKDRSPTKTNDSPDRLKQKDNLNLKNVRNNSPRKAKKLTRSGKLEIMERAKDEAPVVLLKKLATEIPRVRDERLEDTCSSQETSKKTRKSAPSKLNNTVRKNDHKMQSHSLSKPRKTKGSSNRLVFRTTLGHANCSDHSDYSEHSTSSSNCSRTWRDNAEAINNKRNRTPLITITSDEEDDLENLIQLLPRKRVRARSAREKQQDATLNLTALRYAHTMEVLSDTTDDIDTVKKNKRKALQLKVTNTKKSEVSIADSTTHEVDEKPTRRSKRIEQMTPMKRKNGVGKSKRLTQTNTNMDDGEDTIEKTDEFTCTEPDMNHVTSTSREEKVPNTKSESQLLGRIHDNSRENLVKKNTQVVERSTRFMRKDSKKNSAKAECTRTKARCLRFQTRLFEDSDSECLSSSSCPLSGA